MELESKLYRELNHVKCADGISTEQKRMLHSGMLSG